MFKKLAIEYSMAVGQFCEPRSPWQRGSIESDDGRLRVDMPRKTKLSNYTDKDIQDLAMLYNNTPRKCLGYQTPTEIILNEIDVALANVNLALSLRL